MPLYLISKFIQEHFVYLYCSRLKSSSRRNNGRAAPGPTHQTRLYSSRSLDLVKGPLLRFSVVSPAFHGGESWLNPVSPCTSIFAVFTIPASTAANVTSSPTSSPSLSAPSSPVPTLGLISKPSDANAASGFNAFWSCPTASRRTTPSSVSSTASSPKPYKPPC